MEEEVGRQPTLRRRYNQLVEGVLAAGATGKRYQTKLPLFDDDDEDEDEDDDDDHSILYEHFDIGTFDPKAAAAAARIAQAKIDKFLKTTQEQQQQQVECDDAYERNRKFENDKLRTLKECKNDFALLQSLRNYHNRVSSSSSSKSIVVNWAKKINEDMLSDHTAWKTINTPKKLEELISNWQVVKKKIKADTKALPEHCFPNIVPGGKLSANAGKVQLHSMGKDGKWHETTIDKIMEGREDLQNVFRLDGVKSEHIVTSYLQKGKEHFDANVTLAMHPLVFLALSAPLYPHTGDVHEQIHVCSERARLKTQVEIQKIAKMPVRPKPKVNVIVKPGFFITKSIQANEFKILEHDQRHRMMVQHINGKDIVEVALQSNDLLPKSGKIALISEQGVEPKIKASFKLEEKEKKRRKRKKKKGNKGNKGNKRKKKDR